MGLLLTTGLLLYERRYDDGKEFVVAYGIEIPLMVEAAYEDAAVHEFICLVEKTITEEGRLGLKPLSTLPKPDPMLLEKFNSGKKWLGVDLQFRLDTPTVAYPAFVLSIRDIRFAS